MIMFEKEEKNLDAGDNDAKFFVEKSNANHLLDYVLPEILCGTWEGDVKVYLKDGCIRSIHKFIISLASKFLMDIFAQNDDQQYGLSLPDVDGTTFDEFFMGIYGGMTNEHHPFVPSEMVKMLDLMNGITPGHYFDDLLLDTNYDFKQEPSIDDKFVLKYNVCSVCDKVFKSRRSLMKHSQTAHGKTLKVKPHIPKCFHCGKILATNSALRMHIKSVHEGAKPFTCNYCGKCFTQAGNLHAHIVAMHVSIGERPHTCNLCLKNYKTRNDLDKHRVVVHERQKVDFCPTCRKQFVCKSTMLRHMKRVHEGARRFLCHLCPKSFFLASLLRDHSNVHNGLKPFECSICLQTFHSNDNMRKHKNSVHCEKKRILCHVCSYVVREENMADHMKEHEVTE